MKLKVVWCMTPCFLGNIYRSFRELAVSIIWISTKIHLLSRRNRYIWNVGTYQITLHYVPQVFSVMVPDRTESYKCCQTRICL